MGKFYGGPNSPYYGKVGAVVARKWRTENVVSMYNPKVKNPNTKPQQIVRLKFTYLSTLCAALSRAINIGFFPESVGKKQFARCFFMKWNMGNVTVTLPDTVEIDYSSLLVANGSLAEVHFGSPQFDEPLTVEVGFTANGTAPGASADDEIYVLAYCPDDGRAILSTPVKRNAESVRMTVPGYWSGAKVQLWGFAAKAGELDTIDDVSKSTYIGSGNIG